MRRKIFTFQPQSYLTVSEVNDRMSISEISLVPFQESIYDIMCDHPITKRTVAGYVVEAVVFHYLG